MDAHSAPIARWLYFSFFTGMVCALTPMPGPDGWSSLPAAQYQVHLRVGACATSHQLASLYDRYVLIFQYIDVIMSILACMPFCGFLVQQYPLYSSYLSASFFSALLAYKCYSRNSSTARGSRETLKT